MQRLYTSCADAETWKQHLADPEKHWRTGYSAKTLAYCWQAAQAEERGLPREVADAADAVPGLKGLALLVGLPEHKVALPGGSRGSQTDLWFLGRTAEKTVSVAVEGKVKESFGPTVGEWIGGDSTELSGKPKRLDALRKILGIEEKTELGAFRYQLIHRTASAVLEAQRFHSKAALMLVHSFGGSTNFDDYREFTGLFGEQRGSRGIFKAGELGETEFYLGWVDGDHKWLAV